jgi:3-hydroxyacyl-[acyl-carrier-protein] dehydratase
MNGSNAHVAIAIPIDHPAFAGHFPGRPILPGVVLLAEAIAAVTRSTGTRACDWTLESAKFLAPVPPGAKLSIAQSAMGAGSVRFEIRADDAVAASGVLARAASPEA